MQSAKSGWKKPELLASSRLESMTSLATRLQVADVELQLRMRMPRLNVIHIDGRNKFAAPLGGAVLAPWRFSQLGFPQSLPGRGV